MCDLSLRVYIFFVLCRHFVPEKNLVSVGSSPLDTSRKPTAYLLEKKRLINSSDILRPCRQSLILQYPQVIAKVMPCIYFKLNNIWGWEPRPVKCGDPSKAHLRDDPSAWDHDEDGPLDDCPESLRKHLQSPAAKEAGPDNIWIDCNGRCLDQVVSLINTNKI